MRVRSIADQTPLSDADAEEIATRIQYESTRATVNAEAKRAATEAAQTAGSTDKAMLGGRSARSCSACSRRSAAASLGGCDRMRQGDVEVTRTPR